MWVLIQTYQKKLLICGVPDVCVITGKSFEVCAFYCEYG